MTLAEYGAAAWAAYDGSLTQAPVLTKCCTSLVGFTLGDTLAQWTVGGRKRLDLIRTARFATYGFCVHATSCHLLYSFLDQNVSPHAPTSPKAVATKLFLDQCIFAPLSVMLFYAVLKTLEGRPHEIRSTWRDKLWPTLRAGYAVWPIANMINFVFIPARQRVLYLNVIQVPLLLIFSAAGALAIREFNILLVEVAWNVVLCRIASSEKPTPEKRRTGLGVKDHAEPRKQTLSQYLQSMRKPGRHKDDLLPLKAHQGL